MKSLKKPKGLKPDIQASERNRKERKQLNDRKKAKEAVKLEGVLL